MWDRKEISFFYNCTYLINFAKPEFAEWVF